VKRAEVQFPQAAAQRLTLDHTERCQSSFPSNPSTDLGLN